MIAAALCNALASVLQRRADRAEPESAEFSIRMFADLLRRPVWSLGIATMIVGFVLHAVSISVSRIALVQPLLIAELPFTLLLASWVFRLRMSRRDWVAILLAAVGVAAFLEFLAPTGGDPNAVPAHVWLIAGVATVATVTALVIAGYRGKHEHRAALLGIATGAAFGLNSALIAGVGAAVSHGGSLFGAWQTYAVAVVGPVSFFLLQNALTAGNLVASQPGFTLTNPLVSVVWGLAVFGEHSRGGPWLIGTVVAALLVAAGTILLARSPLLDPDTSQGSAGSESEDSEREPASGPTSS